MNPSRTQPFTEPPGERQKPMGMPGSAYTYSARQLGKLYGSDSSPPMEM